VALLSIASTAAVIERMDGFEDTIELRILGAHGILQPRGRRL
jgi:hypothetical protein